MGTGVLGTGVGCVAQAGGSGFARGVWWSSACLAENGVKRCGRTKVAGLCPSGPSIKVSPPKQGLRITRCRDPDSPPRPVDFQWDTVRCFGKPVNNWRSRAIISGRSCLGTPLHFHTALVCRFAGREKLHMLSSELTHSRLGAANNLEESRSRRSTHGMMPSRSGVVCAWERLVCGSVWCASRQGRQ